MIPQAQSAALRISLPTIFEPPSPRDTEVFDELTGLYLQAKRVARYFAKRYNRLHDFAFCDECEAEALFVLCELYWTNYEGICEKYPNIIERHTFVRMSIGYKLKEYWAFRPTSTISYLEKKGIRVKHVPLTDNIVSHHSELEEYIVMDAIAKDAVEKIILEFTMMGNSRELISEKMGMSLKLITKILRKIRKRLRLLAPKRFR